MLGPIDSKPTTKQLLELISKYLDYDFDDTIATWFVADYPIFYKWIKDENKVFCSEFIAIVMQELEIMDKKNKPAWYHPGDFYKSGINYNKNISFGAPYFFNFPKEETSLFLAK